MFLQVDSVNKHGILLDVVQVISDMNLVITKAYISSDGVWFMDGKFPILHQWQAKGKKKRLRVVIIIIFVNFASDSSIYFDDFQCLM